MSGKHLWFGYMEAGEKSSPVVIDKRIDTGNSATVYVYNQQRHAILEYRRDIAEPKLRVLAADEEDLIAQLRSDYKQARSEFEPRTQSLSSIMKQGKKATQAIKAGKGNEEDSLIPDSDSQPLDEQDEWLDEA